MNRSQTYLKIIFLIIFTTSLTFAQDVKVCDLLGKNLKTVINQMGKPVHQDKSNKSMQCIYYKKKDFQMAFVADEEGVYQIQGFRSYSSKDKASKQLDNMLKKCCDIGFVTDTLNQCSFKLKKQYVRLNLSLNENSYTKRYDVKIDAQKSEY